MERRYRISAVAAALATAAVMIVSGCSSSSSGSSGSSPGPSASSSGAGTSASAAVTAAEALVAKYTGTQPADNIVPLKSKPPTGKTLAIITCTFPSCITFANDGVAAATKLGWKTKIYSEGGTVETYASVWGQVLQTPPNLIFFVDSLPNSLITAQLAKVHQLNIPMVATSTSENPTDAIRATISGYATTTLAGKLMGAAVVADAKGPAKTLWFWDPENAVAFGPIKNSFTQEVTAAGGSVDVLNVSGGDIGEAVPGQVVSYLQAHPDIKYLAAPVSVFLPGVPQALKAAGLSGVKIVSQGPAPSDLAALKEGTEWAMIATENATQAYRAIDALARITEGMPFSPDPVAAAQILTKANATNSIEPAQTSSPIASFLTAWHVS
jgi:ABC-type sugar transport system substrate-binding protein